MTATHEAGGDTYLQYLEERTGYFLTVYKDEAQPFRPLKVFISLSNMSVTDNSSHGCFK